MQLYLHIGIHKTGSSAIQRFLYQNRKQLLKNGWIYPNHATRGSAHHPLAALYLEKERRPKFLSEYKHQLAGLKKFIKAHPQEIMLLSSEYFGAIENVERLKNDLCSTGFTSIKIIVYLRRQDEILVSGYNQVVKAKNETRKFDVHFNKMNWFTLLQKWEKAFSKENLIVRAYQKEQLTQGLTSHFTEILGLNDVKWEKPEQQVNQSLDLDLLEVKRLANIVEYPLSISTLNKINNMLTSFPQQKLLSKQQSQEIINYFSESNKQVAQRYLKRENLFDKESPKDEKEIFQGLQLEKVVTVMLGILIDSKRANHRHFGKKIQKNNTLLFLCFIAIFIQTIAISYLLFKIL
ncbi:hypothetical protein [Candidatus Uabimicrobium sp. HlEnr_7]|uniref:hypothetical protein n=1 Tax=Candidatus Uabimicrobium helgolandensis TaxID=3095367 RepID=UPI0035569A86